MATEETLRTDAAYQRVVSAMQPFVSARSDAWQALDVLRDRAAENERLRAALRGYHDLAPRIAEYLNDIGAALAYSDLHRANEKAEVALAAASGGATE